MKNNSSATLRLSHALPVQSGPAGAGGIGWGFLGVLAFSFTVPFTRVAVADGHMSPLFVGAGRATLAAALAIIALSLTRQRLPRGRQWLSVSIVAAGIVVGFPLLTSYALTVTRASHGAIVIALLPAATAMMVVIRARERPPRMFWIMAALGAVAAIGFAVIHSGGIAQLSWPDLLLFGAVIAAAVGYAEGGLLSRELGSWQTVSWALVVAAPIMAIATLVSLTQGMPTGGAAQWGSFAYLGVVSMYLGFFAWYRGLAIGPMAQVSQVQLTQPVMSLVWAAVLLGEQLTAATLLGGFAVILCAALAVRSRLGLPGPGRKTRNAP